MKEDKKRILEMLSLGKITVAEAEKLLLADNEKTQTEETASPPTSKKKALHLFVREGEKTKVNIHFPLAWAEFALKLIPKNTFKIEGHKINVPELLGLIKAGQVGELVNIETTDEGNPVLVKLYVD